MIAERGGRLVKLMGDGALVEFPSVVEAVAAALAIQQKVAAGDGPIRLRIGINLGDVIIDGDDICGDGVNVAARLEALAEPGGICIASIVHESIGNRVEAEFADAGGYEVTLAIVTTIEPHLAETERQRARRKVPESLDAWESYQRGLWHLYQYTLEDPPLGARFMEQAVERDPDFALA